MEIDRIELKRRAREAMGRTEPRFWLVALVYLLATTGVSLAMDLIPFPSDPNTGLSTTSLFVTIFITLYCAVVGFGFDLWSLWTYRGLSPGLGALFQGFSVAGRVILMEIMIFLRILGWCMILSLVLTVPIILTSSPLGVVVLVVVIYTFTWAIQLRYALSPYLLADRPDDGAGAAVRRSVELMRGWKWQLFKLEFSFVGWELIKLLLSGAVLGFFLWQSGFFSALTSGSLPQLETIYYTVAGAPAAAILSNLIVLPLSLWLEPYRSVARAGFYNSRLQAQADNAPPL